MTPKPPLSSQAFTSSLKARAANTSKTTGVPTGELLERYYHRRLLARVFHADDESWVLKGGQALLVRWPRARYSTDIDLLRAVDEATIDEAVSALITAVSTDLDDHLRFDHHDTSRETAAMYERHGERLLPSTRFKDLVDLVLIANKSSLSGATTHAALHAEVRRRQAAGTHLILPETFAVPSPAWQTGYRSEAAKAHELPVHYRALDGATTLADAFISPLLRKEGPPGTWDFERCEWC